MLTADTDFWALALLNDDRLRRGKRARLSHRPALGMESSSPSSSLQNSRGFSEADGKRREFSMRWTVCFEREASLWNLLAWPGRHWKRPGTARQVLRTI